MSTFDPNKLDIDFDNLDKPVEHESVREDTRPPALQAESPKDIKKSDPLDSIKVEKKEVAAVEVKASVETKQEEEKPKKESSMLSEILEDNSGSDTTDIDEKQDNKIKTVYDINVTSLDDIIHLLLNNEYDFVTLEPEEDEVKVIFRQDKTPVNTKLIKYVTYTKLLLKIKSLTKLTVEDTESSQVGSGEYQFKNKWYKIASKTSPSPQWEKIFLKVTPVEKKVAAAKSQQASFKTMLKFIGIVAFLFLVLGWSFITFVVLNAKDVNDVSFFRTLWINPNDINAFIQQIVTILFAILVFLETVFVVIYTVKFFITKKNQKAKRVASWILAALFLIITFITATVWLTIDEKVKNLPNWWDVARGDIQVYDNSILSSEWYSKDDALFSELQLKQLIGPIDVNFNVAVLSDNEARTWFKIEKYIWDFGESEGWWIIETTGPQIIYTFDQQKTYDITLTLEWTDSVGQDLVKTQAIPKVEVTDLIEITEEILDSGGKMITFNAESLKQKGTLEWYYGNEVEVPASKGYIFQPGKPIFEETTIYLNIKNSLVKQQNKFDRVFVIKPESDDNINADIFAQADIENSLSYEFSAINIENDFGGWVIKSFKWIIDGKEFSRDAKPDALEKSSQLDYEFKRYGEHEVQVVLTDSLGKTKTLTDTITIDKQLTLTQPLSIVDEDDSDVVTLYKVELWEYWIDELAIPNTLTLSARKIKTQDSQYSLQSVKWDLNNDGDIDSSDKQVEHEVPIAGDSKIKVYYSFIHRLKETELLLEETIYIQAIKKDAIIKLNIEKDTQYVPVTVRFDASQSRVLDQDIVKFEYDYGDGIIEERDAINEGHIYRQAGEYDVVLTVTTDSGEKYSKSEKLVLKTKPDIVKITPSLYDAPAYQEIDFSSDDSSGQIISYFWTFGDGETSTSANPSHSYTQPWEYSVTLQIEFENNNIKTDEITVNILP